MVRQKGRSEMTRGERNDWALPKIFSRFFGQPVSRPLFGYIYTVTCTEKKIYIYIYIVENDVIYILC